MRREIAVPSRPAQETADEIDPETRHGHPEVGCGKRLGLTSGIRSGRGETGAGARNDLCIREFAAALNVEDSPVLRTGEHEAVIGVADHRSCERHSRPDPLTTHQRTARNGAEVIQGPSQPHVEPRKEPEHWHLDRRPTFETRSRDGVTICRVPEDGSPFGFAR